MTQKINTAQTKLPETANTWTKAQSGAYVTLSSSSNSIAVDLSLSNNFKHTTSEDAVLAAPTNLSAGQSGVIEFTQGATARLITYNATWKFAGGTDPILTATVGAKDILSYIVDSTATYVTCVMINDVK